MSAEAKGRSGEGKPKPPKTFFNRPVVKHGDSYVITLPKPLRKLIGCDVGDEISFRKVGRVVVISVLRAFQVIQVSEEEKRKAVEAVGV